MDEQATTNDAGQFSDRLERWLRSDDEKTIGALGAVSEEKSFALTILLLMFVPALPLPTGGVTHVFEAITVLLGAEMVLGRRMIWLPQRWLGRKLGGITTERGLPFVLRWIRRVERISRPRGAWIFRQGWMLRLLGLVFILFAVGAAVAPPFSGLDTLPALGAVAVALAIILEDVLVLVVGLALGAGGIVLIATIGATLVHVVRGLF